MGTGALAAVVATGLLAGCTGDEPKHTSDPTVESAVADTAHEFLQAQADGRFGDAVALSTLRPEDVACDWIRRNDGMPGLVGPEVVSVTVADAQDTARAEVTYRSGGQIVAALDLVARDEGWVVEWPETYQIDAQFSQPAVAELVLDDAAIGDEHCAVAAIDGEMSMAVFPGVYVARVQDPSGVLDYQLGVNTTVDGAMREEWDLGDPVAELPLNELQIDAFGALEEGRITCDGVLCEDELAQPDESVEAIKVVKVWTDDGQHWRTEVEVYGTAHEGMLKRSPDGNLRLDLVTEN